MSGSFWFAVGAIAAGLGVVIGAFGAHGLPEFLASRGISDTARLIENFETGVRYHMYHAMGLALLGLAAAYQPHGAFKFAGFLFVFGILVFSGLLYAIALGGPKWLGAIVPIGGIAMIVAWFLLAWGGYAALAKRP